MVRVCKTSALWKSEGTVHKRQLAQTAADHQRVCAAPTFPAPPPREVRPVLATEDERRGLCHSQTAASGLRKARPPLPLPCHWDYLRLGDGGAAGPGT